MPMILDRSLTGSSVRSLVASAERGSGLRNAISEVLQNAQRPEGGVAAHLSGAMVTPGLVDEVLFLSVLRSAIQKATESHNFDLEAHINDLFLKLGQIRQSRADTLNFQALVQRNSPLASTLRAIVDSFHETAKNTIQNIRA